MYDNLCPYRADGEMMKTKLLLGLVAFLVIAIAIGPASAANPHSTDNPTGQPSQSCQAFFGDAGPFIPAGFNTAGIVHATTFYAGAGHSLISNNPKAVSQYDVACFQQFMRI